jgi:hypothetical protein
MAEKSLNLQGQFFKLFTCVTPPEDRKHVTKSISAHSVLYVRLDKMIQEITGKYKHALENRQFEVSLKTKVLLCKILQNAYQLPINHSDISHIIPVYIWINKKGT